MARVNQSFHSLSKMTPVSLTKQTPVEINSLDKHQTATLIRCTLTSPSSHGFHHNLQTSINNPEKQLHFATTSYLCKLSQLTTDKAYLAR